MKLIDRNQYLDKLINVIGTPDIKFITGERRSGKSKLLEAFKDYVEADEAARIVPLMRMNYATMHLYRMNRKDRNRCVEWLLHFYRLHIPDFPELRSWLVLRELYASN